MTEAVKQGSISAQRELANPSEFPPNLWDIWQWFLRLKETRQGMLGTGVISEQEIFCFFSNRRLKPETWQVEAILDMDLLSRASTEEKDEQ